LISPLTQARVEPVDGLHQADVADLHQLVRRLRAALVPARARAHQQLVAHYEDLAGRGPGPAAGRLVVDEAEQILIIKLCQVRGSSGDGQRRGVRQ
jgi:hypothetical protein